MLLSPRYDGPPILAFEGPDPDPLVPVVRQRRRLEAILATLDDAGWGAPSRCDGWTVQDVVAHLAGVTAFWEGSVTAGLNGTPTTILAAFDPAATPPMMVEGMRSLSPTEVLARFVSSNDGFLGVISTLDDAGWSTVAEAPPGHVSIRRLSEHALWDSWVHERDIVLPLGGTPVEEADEVLVSLRYATALSPALAFGADGPATGVFAVETTDPSASFVLEVDESVVVRDGPAPDGAACLRGPAVDLLEAVSIRSPLPASAPDDWWRLVNGLATAFDSDLDAGTRPA